MNSLSKYKYKIYNKKWINYFNKIMIHKNLINNIIQILIKIMIYSKNNGKLIKLLMKL